MDDWSHRQPGRNIRRSTARCSPASSSPSRSERCRVDRAAPQGRTEERPLFRPHDQRHADAATDSSGAAIAASARRRRARDRRPPDRPRRTRGRATRRSRRTTGIAQVIVTTGGTGITVARQHLRGDRRRCSTSARRLRRAVPHAQLPADRSRGDAEPRRRRHHRPDRGLRAAGIGTGRAPGARRS